jgi:hypothetical protein
MFFGWIGGELVAVFSLLDVVEGKRLISRVQSFDGLDELLMVHE